MKKPVLLATCAFAGQGLSLGAEARWREIVIIGFRLALIFTDFTSG